MPFVYDFDHSHRRPPMELKDLLGGKGANLAEMTSVLRLPVPHGFTISTDACRAYMHGGWPDSLTAEVRRARGRLEKKMGKRLGDPVDPLLVSVRSGAKFSMPGMMDTVLNLGLNDESVLGLAKQTDDERFAYDSYRRFVAMYGRIVLGVPGEAFDTLLDEAKERSGAAADADVPVTQLHSLVFAYKQIITNHTGADFPQDPDAQLRGAIEAVFGSWNGPRAIAYRDHEGIAHDLGTAVNVQAMVFGNRDDKSGTGVGFTRDPATGAKGEYGDFLVNAQGEDVVAGIRNTEPLSALKDKFPKIHAELLAIFVRLERHYRDMCDTEFTIEQGKLWMLQTRVGKRTGRAALRMAVEMTTDPGIRLTRAEAVERVTAEHLEQVLHPQFAGSGQEVLTKGLGASPGAAVGRVYLTADDAAAAAERGERVILVRSETSPEDVHGMLASQGILTARGGLVSHAAVVARGWGKPAVVGAEKIRIAGRSFTVGATVVNEGDWISIDGTAGAVVLGQVELAEAKASEEFETLLAWADVIRKGHLNVRANADNGPDAANGRRMGAEGIGLCRTEHMFIAEDRLPIVRRMILAEDTAAEDAALEELRVAQRADFIEILEAMDGLPVTVRLLDPPLHEFLPDTGELAIKEATVGLSAEEQKLFEAAKQWHEFNPMLGTRGVRLGVIKPGLYSMQVRALMEAAVQRVADGGTPVIEIMIPLTVTREELALARTWVEEAVTAALAGSARADRRKLAVTIGTMIETPRAALRAGEIAEVADFFSFGTNDLTQMTFGFSRDDVEGRMMSAYLEKGLLKHNPFEVVDADGVGELVRLGVSRGRATRPSLKVGVCGEHGGDPESIGVFADAGCDYVSCSPFRVPIARLSAAQVVLARAPQRTSATRTRPSGATTGPRKSAARKVAKAAKRAPVRKAAKRALARKAAKRAPARKAAKRASTAVTRPPGAPKGGIAQGRLAQSGLAQSRAPQGCVTESCAPQDCSPQCSAAQGCNPQGCRGQEAGPGPGQPGAGDEEGRGRGEASGATQGQVAAPPGPPIPVDTAGRYRPSVAIPDEDVVRVRSATDIVALISEHAALKKQGTRWVGLCPFHQEKTPSFSVNAEMGVFHCFGCQQSGDAITFVREFEHVDFVEAVRRLAERAGVTITEDPTATADRQRRAPLHEAMEKAVDFYHERLLSSADAGPARDYLRSRGYDGEIVRQFRLGWAPDDWDSLAKHIKVSDKVLTDAGLGFVNRRGRAQDAFRARVMFPIFDTSGKPIALGGRILPPPVTDDPADALAPGPVGRPGAGPGPKYKNSQDGPIYSKRRTLYGLNWAKRDVIENGEVIVCEGYTDVIAFFVAGMPRAVATCGTALGEEHFRLLRNFARRVVLAYDADAAGQEGAGRVYEWERHHEVDVAVAALPAGADPADLARDNPAALRAAIAEAKPFLAFRVDRVLQSADLRSAEGRAKAAEAALAVVAEHPNELVRDQYLMLVADRCRLEPDALRALATRVAGQARAAPAETNGSRPGRPANHDPDPGDPEGRSRGAGRGPGRSEASRPGLEALRLAVHRPERVGDRLESVLFPDELQRAAFVALTESDDLHQAVEAAEDHDPRVAGLLRRLAVEEPATDADDVVVTLVRNASRRALAVAEAQVRLSPNTVGEIAPVIARVRHDLDELDDPERCLVAADRLLAWLVGRDDTNE